MEIFLAAILNSPGRNTDKSYQNDSMLNVMRSALHGNTTVCIALVSSWFSKHGLFDPLVYMYFWKNNFIVLEGRGESLQIS